MKVNIEGHLLKVATPVPCIGKLSTFSLRSVGSEAEHCLVLFESTARLQHPSFNIFHDAGLSASVLPVLHARNAYTLECCEPISKNLTEVKRVSLTHSPRNHNEKLL